MQEYKKCRLLWSQSEFMELVGQKNMINRQEYKIYNALLLGCIPSDTEVDMFFGKNDLLPRKKIESIVSNKLYNEKGDFHSLEIFRAFDVDFKGYIDTLDLLRASKSATPHLSRQVLLESFNELSPAGNLDYETFKNICLMCDQ
ncbi:hypothetical protein ILUMI_03446 [Ignelater luminosus]|uniref:EF-hand domain-containing protein n=1 Tax=Ignelater luminosus TaxID=2038154 RepID=A0A8K0DAZ5_IGNLU|nr:hypothetical protein ILUMI_03446 [Ignelater luminosus]